MKYIYIRGINILTYWHVYIFVILIGHCLKQEECKENFLIGMELKVTEVKQIRLSVGDLERAIRKALSRDKLLLHCNEHETQILCRKKEVI